MKSRRRSCGQRAGLSLPSPIVAVAVGVLCITYIHLSQSASIPSATSSSSKGKISSLRTGKARADVQPGRMKASDIKACISKAFCEVNSASRTPNYSVNKEFFDLMNQIHELSNEDIDSGSTSVEYDDDDDDDDDDASSEESSSERLRGYPPPPPPPRYRRGREMELGNGTSSLNGTDTTSTVTETSDKTKLKKKSKKKSKPVEGQKMVKKFVNGTFVSVPKRRSRIETTEEKAEKKEFLNRKQREMGQVNDLAALIRISADIGLTLRSPRKCRTLFNKCTMSHEQIVDLFNQTLLAVTTPATSSKPSSVPTTKRAKISTTLAAAITSSSTSSADTSPPSVRPSPFTTVQEALTPTLQTAATTVLTTQAPTSTTTDDGNRSSKSRHDFSDEDVEYMTDTEIQPVHTYALFVNDAPEDTGKTVEETSNVQDTFKQYANAFPIETALPGDIPSLRKRSNKKKSLKSNGVHGRSNGVSKITKRRRASSEEDDDDDEDDEDDVGSTSMEDATAGKNGFRIEDPYPGYRVNKEGVVDDDKSIESAEPNSAPVGKESSEGILPPLVQKEKPKVVKDEDEEEDEEESSEEEDDIDADDETGLGVKGSNLKGKKPGKYTKSNNKKKPAASKKPSLAHEDESSEEDDIDQPEADDPSGHPSWRPVYQMYSKDKKKQGYSKKQKGPYKGGEGPYSDEQSHVAPQTPTSSFTSFLKKPWGGNSHSGSQEIPAGGALPTSHESGYPGYQNQQYHGGLPGGPTPYGGSHENVGGAEQKPGFFQSIMSWFTGNKNGEQGMPHPGEGGYGSGPFGGPAGHVQHTPYGEHGSIENDEPHKSATGAPWPSQPDPAGVGHFGQGYRYRGQPKRPASSEEDEELIDEPEIISKKAKKSKRRYRGRSDSIITSQPKKAAAPAKKTTGPPPPVVIVPKDSKSVAPAGNSPVGVYEPNQQYEKLIQADGGITSGGNAGKKVVASSTKENKRSKKAATKPSKAQNPNKKTKKQSQRATDPRTSRESAEDDDEAYSSEELYNQQVAKMKKGSGSAVGSSSTSANNGGNTPMNDSPASSKPANSFPSYFESMFGTEDKDKYKIKGKDDGSLLYGFDSLSSHLSATPSDLGVTQAKKKESSYKVNKNKKRSKISSQPVKFNNEEVIESSEEQEKRK